MKTWDVGLLLFSFEVTANAERCRRQSMSSLGQAFLPYWWGFALVCVTLLSPVRSWKTNDSLVTVRRARLTTAWIGLVSWVGFHVPEFRNSV